MFNAEEQKTIGRWFQKLAPLTKECRCCGQFDEAFTHPDLVCVPIAASGQQKSLEHALTFLVRECRACGYVMFFNADTIGVRHG